METLKPELMNSDASFPEAEKAFVDLWGEMASRWGISKSMAQVYALLYARPYPMDTESIMEELHISRGNANINIRKLIDWGLLLRTERSDTRREFYTAEKDVWQMTENIIRQRRQRELTDLATQLKEIARSLPETDSEKADFRKRLLEMADFITLFDDMSQILLPLLEMKEGLSFFTELIRQVKPGFEPEPTSARTDDFSQT